LADIESQGELPDRARDAIDLVAATVRPAGRIVKYSIFGVDFLDGGPPTRGVVFNRTRLEDCELAGSISGHGLSPFLHRVWLVVEYDRS